MNPILILPIAMLCLFVGFISGMETRKSQQLNSMLAHMECLDERKADWRDFNRVIADNFK